jgi:hypothetical protein
VTRVLDQVTVATIEGVGISLASVLRRSHADGLRRLVEEEIRDRIIAWAIAERRIEVHGEEVARARAIFLADHGLTDPELDRWLAKREMTRQGFEHELARIIAFGKLKEIVVGDQVDPSLERKARAEAHQRAFERWLDDERSRLRIEMKYREIL